MEKPKSMHAWNMGTPIVDDADSKHPRCSGAALGGCRMYLREGRGRCGREGDVLPAEVAGAGRDGVPLQRGVRQRWQQLLVSELLGLMDRFAAVDVRCGIRCTVRAGAMPYFCAGLAYATPHPAVPNLG